MKFNQNLAIGGEFKYVVYDKDGNIKEESSFQDNLATDNMFKYMMCMPMTSSTNTSIAYPSNGSYTLVGQSLAIGSGTTEPSTADISLSKFSGFSDSKIPSTDWTVERSSETNHKGLLKFINTNVFTFSKLDTGAITEIGMCGLPSNQYTLFTHALIKDSNGNVSPINVNSGDILQIIYNINIYAPEAPQSAVLKVITDGDPNNFRLFNYVQYVSGVPNRAPWDYTAMRQFYAIPALETPKNGTFDLDTLKNTVGYGYVIGKISDTVKNTTLYYGTDASDPTKFWYKNIQTDWATMTRRFTLTVNNNGLIFTNGIRVVQFSDNLSPLNTFIFSAVDNTDAIPKDVNHQWEIDFVITYGRYKP